MVFWIFGFLDFWIVGFLYHYKYKGQVILVSFHKDMAQMGRNAAHQLNRQVGVFGVLVQFGFQLVKQEVQVLGISSGKKQGRAAAPQSPVHGFVLSRTHNFVLDAASAPNQPCGFPLGPGPLYTLLSKVMSYDVGGHRKGKTKAGEGAKSGLVSPTCHAQKTGAQ